MINKTQLETNGKLIRETKWEQENQIWAREEGKHKTQGDRTDIYVVLCIFATLKKKKTFQFLRIRRPFPSKCMLRMRKRRKSNLIQFFFMTDESFGCSV